MLSFSPEGAEGIADAENALMLIDGLLSVKFLTLIPVNIFALQYVCFDVQLSDKVVADWKATGNVPQLKLLSEV